MSSIRFGDRNARRFFRNQTQFCLVVISLISIAVPTIACQDGANKPNDEPKQLADQKTVTVKGQFVDQRDQFGDFELTDLNASLVELIEFQQPEWPANWETMTVEQRQKWISDFEASEEGKAMISANQALEESRTTIGLKIDSDGTFVAYDVPRGQFQLQAMAEVDRDGKTYIVQAFGLITVGDVDEVQLGAMPLEIIRNLKMQELAPEISGKTFSGEQASLSALQGKHVLINFVELGNAAFADSVDAIREALANPELAGNFAVLTISVDEDAEAAQKVIAEKSIDWPCIALGGRDAGMLNSWGVKSIPSFWLLDPEGRIVLTGQQFLFKLRRTGIPLDQLIGDTIAGRLTIGGEGADADRD